MEFLSTFNFVISYTPDRKYRKADSLTRWLNDCLADYHNDWQQHLLQTIFLPKRLEISSIDLDKSETSLKKVIQINLTDLYYIKLCKKISIHSVIEGINTCNLSDLSIDTRGCICRFNRLWVPNHLQLMVIREVHDQITTDHPSYEKIVSFITRNYYWLGLKKIVQCYIQNCHSCRRAKALKDRYNGLLKPLLISSCPWTDVTLDFVTDLPISNSYNTILMIVDCLTKEKYYISYSRDKNRTTTKAIAQLLL